MLDIHGSQAPPAQGHGLPSVQNTAFGALPQSGEFLRALMATGQAPVQLAGPEGPIVTRRTLPGGLPLAMINRVSLPRPGALFDLLADSALAGTPTILAPDHPCPELADLGALPLVTPAHVARLDIAPKRETNHLRLHQKWRNRLSRAQDQAKALKLRITRQNMPQDSLHWLLASDQMLQGQRGYRSWPVALTLAYAKENPGQAKLFQLFEGKETVAAVLILRHGSSATYHIAHSSTRGKALSAHNLLMWEVISWLADKGCLFLDLGLINTEEAPGLARFKLGTGAKLHPLGGTWLYQRRLRPLIRPLARLGSRQMGGS